MGVEQPAGSVAAEGLELPAPAPAHRLLDAHDALRQEFVVLARGAVLAAADERFVAAAGGRSRCLAVAARRQLHIRQSDVARMIVGQRC